MAAGDLASTSRISGPYTTGDRWVTVTSVNLGTYATGGFNLSRATLGFASTADPEFDVDARSAGGYVFSYDHTNSKLLAYRQTAATSALIEVPNTTDLSSVTGVRVKATGKYAG